MWEGGALTVKEIASLPLYRFFRSLLTLRMTRDEGLRTTGGKLAMTGKKLAMT